MTTYVSGSRAMWLLLAAIPWSGCGGGGGGGGGEQAAPVFDSWSKTHAVALSIKGFPSFQTLSDGGTIAAISTETLIHLVRLDATGTVTNMAALPRVLQGDEFPKVRQAPNGTFLVLSPKAMKIWKLDANLAVLNEQPLSMTPTDLYPNADSGCTIVGSIANAPSELRILAPNLSQVGPTVPLDTVEDLILSPSKDGSLLVAGKKKVSSELVVYRFDPISGLSTPKSYAFEHEPMPTSAQPTGDGGHVVIGVIGAERQEGEDDMTSNRTFVIKLNSQGSEQWTKIYTWDAGIMGGSIRPLPGGGFLIGGLLASAQERFEGFVGRLDAYGLSAWMKKYREESICGIFFVDETPDGGIKTGGVAASSRDSISLWMMKLAPDGSLPADPAAVEIQPFGVGVTDR